VQAGESYLGCHIHVYTLVSRASQPEAGGCDCDVMDGTVLFLFFVQLEVFLSFFFRKGYRVLLPSKSFIPFDFAVIVC
jgi:hypothetical protein